MVENDFTPIQENGSLRDVVNAISHSQRNTFPVVDQDNNFKGVIKLDDIREIMFKPDLYHDTTVSDLQQKPAKHIYYGETMEEVMRKFDESGDWILPIIDDDKYKGFLSKSKIFSHYRNSLIREAKEENEIMQ